MLQKHPSKPMRIEDLFPFFFLFIFFVPIMVTLKRDVHEWKDSLEFGMILVLSSSQISHGFLNIVCPLLSHHLCHLPPWSLSLWVSSILFPTTIAYKPSTRELSRRRWQRPTPWMSSSMTFFPPPSIEDVDLPRHPFYPRRPPHLHHPCWRCITSVTL